MFQITKIHFVHDDRPAGFWNPVVVAVGVNVAMVTAYMATITTSVTNGTILLFEYSGFLFFLRVGSFVDVLGILWVRCSRDRCDTIIIVVVVVVVVIVAVYLFLQCLLHVHQPLI